MTERSGLPGDGTKWTTTSKSGLSLDVTTMPYSPVLDEFYRGYDAAFVLADEKEDRDGFDACLDLNSGDKRDYLERHGDYWEVVLVARDRPGGEMIGGANFIAYPVGKNLVAGNLNYVFVTREARGKGYFRKLVAACEELMAGLFPSLGPGVKTLAFIELNDPFVLSDEDYRLDSETAGVDQFDRLAIWAKLDAKVVDFPYVQPALSAHQQPDEGLIYAVLGAGDATSLDVSTLLQHLRRFFGISVLKGKREQGSNVAEEQFDRLRWMAERGERVPLLDPKPGIEAGRKLRASGAPRPQGFRQFLRREGEEARPG